MFDLCIKNGLVIRAEGCFRAHIYVKDGVICAFSQGDTTLEANTVIDAAGKYIFPGFVDPHTHLNDPGLTNSEDFYTGTCSAAAGGITTCLEHPITIPLPSTYETLKQKKEICQSKAVTDFALFGAAVPDNIDQIDNMTELGAVAFKAFLTVSPDMPQSKEPDIIAHLENLKGKGPVRPIHCEDQSICEASTAAMRKAGKVSPADYYNGRPEVAEAVAINRMAYLAQYTGGKMHIVHCSIPQGVDIVEEHKKKGVDITVETCPHFLVFDHSIMEKEGIFAICNPPIRDRETVEELWKRVLDNKVDFIGSDHAAYTVEEKEAGLEDCFNTPAGLTGIQTGFIAFFSEGVMHRGMSLEQFAAMTSTNTAKRYGVYPKKGDIAIGADADFVIIDPRESWTVKEEDLFYMCPWSPYIGMNIDGKIEKTIVRGTVVYEDGRINVEPGFGKFVKRINND